MPQSNELGQGLLILSCSSSPSASYPAGQCDACPSSEPISFPSDQASPSNGGYRAVPLLNVQLDDGYHLIHTPWTKYAPFIVSRDAYALIEYFKSPRSLENVPVTWERALGSEEIRRTLKRMVTLGILVSEANSLPKLIESLGTLTAWLHVTNACNLRCDYCYLSKTPQEMSQEVGQSAVKAVFRSAARHKYGKVKLKYAGGEPTLNFRLIVRLHSLASRLASQHDLELDGLVLSNGVGVTLQMLEEMQTLGLRLAVSLDGLGCYHDCHRRLLDRNGSFDIVTRTIDLALSCGLIPDISITVSGRNANGVPELVAWLQERSLPFSINFYRENDYSASAEDLCLEDQHIIETMQATYRVIKANLPRQSLLASLADQVNLAVPHLRPCSVGVSYFVVDHLGRIAKCQMDIEHPVTDVSALDPLAEVRAATRGIQNLSVDEKEECSSCEWRYWCSGGCPLATYRSTGRYDAKSPNCAIYKALCPEILRLEGLRVVCQHTTA